MRKHLILAAKVVWMVAIAAVLVWYLTTHWDEFVDYAEEVGPGSIVISVVLILAAKLLLAQVGDAYYAAQRKCPHLGFNLCRGSLDGGAVVCPLHKAKFDLATGKIERDPKLLFIKMNAKSDLKTYPVKVEGSDLLVGV